MRLLHGFSGWLWKSGIALLVWNLSFVPLQAQPAQQGEIEELKKRLEQLEQAPEGSAFSLLKSIEVSGFVDTSFNYNFNEPKAPQENRLRVFDRPANTFSVNILEVALEKKASDPGMAGFRVDFDAGRDVPFFRAAGFEAGNFDIQQAFVTYKAPLGEGLTLTFGKFVSLMGSEMIESPDNFNFSRSFLFGFAQPFTHTGLLLSYPVARMVDLTLGVVNGWDNIDDNNDSKTLVGRAMFNVADTFTFAVAGIYGAEQTNRESPKRWVLDLMGMLMPFPHLHLTFNYDYGREDEAVTIDDRFKDALWQGISLIVHYDLTQQFGLSLRGEFFNDEDGARTGTAQDLWEITLTAAYKWFKGFETRLEYRHDRSNVASFDRDGRPTKTQDTIATEVLFRF